jgi:murein L,D-transpeptidase YafK
LLSAVAEPRVDLVVVEKSKRLLQLVNRGETVKTYRLALGGRPVGPKRQRGDLKTPEGEYTIDGRYAQSEFHRALHISYPNAQDRAMAKLSGVEILIHGLPNGQGSIGAAHIEHDWTLGCIAVTDAELEDIWRLVPNGTKILIKP